MHTVFTRLLLYIPCFLLFASVCTCVKQAVICRSFVYIIRAEHRTGALLNSPRVPVTHKAAADAEKHTQRPQSRRLSECSSHEGEVSDLSGSSVCDAQRAAVALATPVFDLHAALICER